MSAPGETLEAWHPRPAERRLATEMGSGVVVMIGQDVPPDPPPPERVIRGPLNLDIPFPEDPRNPDSPVLKPSQKTQPS